MAYGFCPPERVFTVVISSPVWLCVPVTKRMFPSFSFCRASSYDTEAAPVDASAIPVESPTAARINTNPFLKFITNLHEIFLLAVHKILMHVNIGVMSRLNSSNGARPPFILLIDGRVEALIKDSQKMRFQIKVF
jgi:hypothetical protein